MTITQCDLLAMLRNILSRRAYVSLFVKTPTGRLIRLIDWGGTCP